LSAGASSQTPLGELTALLQTLKLGLRGPSSKGTADRRGRDGTGGSEGEEGRGEAGGSLSFALGRKKKTWRLCA